MLTERGHPLAVLRPIRSGDKEQAVSFERMTYWMFWGFTSDESTRAMCLSVNVVIISMELRSYRAKPRSICAASTESPRTVFLGF